MQRLITILAHPDQARIGEQTELDYNNAIVEISAETPLFKNLETGRVQPLGDGTSESTILFWGLGEAPQLVSSRAASAPIACPLGHAHGVARRGWLCEATNQVLLLIHERPASSEPGGCIAPWEGVGQSDAICQLRRELEQVAATDAAVTLRGETGTGKELAARAIHRTSARQGPFVAVNMATMSASVAASELFGQRAEACNGAARQQPGLFEQADGGTLFLDGIDATPPEVQAMLLRALDAGEIRPLGGMASRQLDVRVLCATDHDLESAVRSGRFRSSLYYRLAGAVIRVPPLRERRDDIPRLLVHFLNAHQRAAQTDERLVSAERNGSPRLPTELAAELVRYDWPGNVRQLKSFAGQLALHNREREQIEVVPPLDGLGAAATTSDPSQRAGKTAGNTRGRTDEQRAGGGRAACQKLADFR